jgi:2,4-dienoyl-CoA reductase-like NADH-dependent reductase (Old Yellow Enzyme family)
MSNQSLLFTPIRVRELEAKNRVWVAPMCMYSCENQDGVVNEFHVVHYGSRAYGGAGLIIVEATGVTPEGRITPWCTGIWNDEQVVAWRNVTDAIREGGSKSAIQLAHAGRKASTYRAQSGHGSVPLSDGGWQSVSSTSEAFEGYAAPRALTTAEVSELPAAFAAAAARSVRAGFDAIELHAAHGYLIHQFLSPITNQREDQYGGSLENRARLLLEVVVAVREVIPAEMPLMIRFSATDYRGDGWNEQQTAQVAAWSAERGADLFDISSGGLITGVKIPSGPGYQVPLSEFVANEVSQPVTAVGQITEALQAEEILQGGGVDIIMLGRAVLRDPYWPLRAAAELGVEVEWPIQYARGKWPTT